MLLMMEEAVKVCQSDSWCHSSPLKCVLICIWLLTLFLPFLKMPEGLMDWSYPLTHLHIFYSIIPLKALKNVSCSGPEPQSLGWWTGCRSTPSDDPLYIEHSSLLPGVNNWFFSILGKLIFIIDFLYCRNKHLNMLFLKIQPTA